MRWPVCRYVDLDSQGNKCKERKSTVLCQRPLSSVSHAFAFASCPSCPSCPSPPHPPHPPPSFSHLFNFSISFAISVSVSVSAEKRLETALQVKDGEQAAGAFADIEVVAYTTEAELEAELAELNLLHVGAASTRFAAAGEGGGGGGGTVQR